MITFYTHDFRYQENLDQNLKKEVVRGMQIV